MRSLRPSPVLAAFKERNDNFKPPGPGERTCLECGNNRPLEDFYPQKTNAKSDFNERERATKCSTMATPPTQATLSRTTVCRGCVKVRLNMYKERARLKKQKRAEREAARNPED